jgi:hypothetical protein
LYLEGNCLQELPDDLFVRLPHLKWLDLRHNQLTEIPDQGLAQHAALRSLLLSNNQIRLLPAELGKTTCSSLITSINASPGQVKTLSALNLDGNPLESPPLDVVKRGLKAIQEYFLNALPCPSGDDTDVEDEPDVWTSSENETDSPTLPRQRKYVQLNSSSVFPHPVRSEDFHRTSTMHALPILCLPCFNRVSIIRE